jgi:TatD DNase family protein
VAALRELASHPKVVAIGEIGLDFYRDRSPRDVQLAAFRRQLLLAADLGLPVVVHARDAEEAVETELTAWSGAHANQHPRALLHCFSGDLAQARRYTDLGFLLSLAGPLTYPRNERLHAVARELALAALTIETDAPYLPPQAHRGQRNEPCYLLATAERLAAERDESLAAVAEATADNAATLFRLPLPVGKPAATPA